MKFYPFCLLAFALAVSSCRTDENVLPVGQFPDDGRIHFTIGTAPLTRVTTGDDFKTVFDEGDEIGLFVVSHSVNRSIIRTTWFWIFMPITRIQKTWIRQRSFTMRHNRSTT